MSSNFASPIHSDRDRLNDLAVSMLDMDDEPRSSYSSNDYDEPDFDEGDQSTIEQPRDDEDSEPPRMSLLGPKMRFHSKAPWEDNSPHEEEDESEDDADVRSVMSRNKSGPSRFRFGSKSSRDSSGSRRMAKKSFDTTSSQTSYGRGAIHTLAQAGMSSASLVTNGSRARFSSGRVRSTSPSSPHFSPSSPRSAVFFADVGDRPSAPRSSGSGESDSRPSFAYSRDDTHPYARSTPQDRPLPNKLNFPASDTFSTIPDSNTSDSPMKPQLQTSFAVESSHEQSPRIQGREISSPVSVRSTALPGENAELLPPRTGNLSGWADNAAPPSFSLISLEEARAQRSRSNTNPNPSFDTSVMAFPHPDDGQGEQSPAHSITSRARARSISAGARAKQALTNMVGTTPPKPERRGSEPAVVANQGSDSSGGKNLKHKKSGFMRLFNGGRDEKSPPPPVPSLSEGYAAFNAQQSFAPKGIKISRVPPPTVSPSMFEQPQLGDDLPSPSPRPMPSPRRTPPSLNLVGSSHATVNHRPQFRGDVAQSAPANVTEFPSLKLRPISTIFSAHFGDHILPSLTSDDEPDTPSSSQSPGAVISPVTPGPYARPDQISHNKTAGSAPSPAEDQSAVIRALQDQILTAKRTWQRQIWELEGQVKDLKAEVEELRSAGNVQGYCELCGRGAPSSGESSGGSVQGDGEEKKPISVVHRPRARTGTGQSRFGSAV